MASINFKLTHIIQNPSGIPMFHASIKGSQEVGCSTNPLLAVIHLIKDIQVREPENFLKLTKKFMPKKRKRKKKPDVPLDSNRFKGKIKMIGI